MSGEYFTLMMATRFWRSLVFQKGISSVSAFHYLSKIQTFYQTLERIIPNGVTETDAPFLSPVPFRGKRNEPINVKTIGEFISKQTGLELSVLAMTLYDNANYLLKWK